MLKRLRDSRRDRRGQALVEFALVLPIMALLIVLAIDFGRAFFGWVSLTNGARIAANYAGYTPDLMTKATERAEYGQLIADSVTGCKLTPASTADAAYDPTFTDIDGDGKSNGWGDHVTVNISCELDLMTPLTQALFGSGVPMRAEAVFPIRTGTFAGPAGGSTPPSTTCTLSRIPDLLNRTLGDARAKWVAEGFDVAKFSVSPTGTSDDYLVNGQTFSDGKKILDCVDPALQSVLVTVVAPPPCPAGSAQVPDMLGMLVPDAKAAWTAAGFTGAFKPATFDPTKVVLTQVTDPVTSPPINGCLAVTASVTITYGSPPPTPCDVPNMIGLTWTAAQDAWNANGFKNALTYSGGNPTAGGTPKTVKEQKPGHPGRVSCDVIGEVKF
jgi:Flp pilus assembly protein TadG